MLELLLFRHGKSAWDRSGLEDHERGLAQRGEKAAAKMGRVMTRNGLVPDLVLCSTATRARRTLALAKASFPKDVAVKELRSLYLAPPNRLLAVIQRQPAEARRLMLVGHNPGLHALAIRLAGRGDPEDLGQLRAKLPTAALVLIRFPGKDWSDIAEHQGELAGYWRPREL